MDAQVEAKEKSTAQRAPPGAALRNGDLSAPAAI